jgi:putative Holliday junction resolvase
MKIMAIDYGDARTGIAISDRTGSIVGTTLVIHQWNADKAAEEIQALVQQHGVERLVMGWPKNMDGTESLRADLYRAFAQKLQDLTGMEPVLWDERWTTVAAHNILTENNRHGKKRKNTVDAVAASLILEGYLASQH